MAKLSFAAVSVSALLLAGAASATPEHFTSAWFFGDSLTDNGNLYDAIGVPPSPPYYDGRSSNGPVWADYIAEDFSAKGLANQNYAYAFATAAGNVDDQFEGYQVPDLAQQIEKFKADANPLGARPLGLVWIGANDIFGAIEDQVPPVLETVGAAAANAAGAVGKGIASLAQAGLKDFLVVNMPGLNLTPALSGSDDAKALGAFATGVYNSFLDQALKSLGGAVSIQLVDVNSAFVDMVENPGDYGLDNVTASLPDPAVDAALHAGAGGDASVLGPGAPEWDGARGDRRAGAGRRGAGAAAGVAGADPGGGGGDFRIGSPGAKSAADVKG